MTYDPTESLLEQDEKYENVFRFQSIHSAICMFVIIIIKEKFNCNLYRQICKNMNN